MRKNIDLGARKNEEDKWEGAQWTPIIGFLDELPKQKTDKQNSVSTNTVTENPADVQVIDETVDITKENLKRFAGIFNGNELSIRGLYIDSDKRYQGLFGYQTGIIQNLTVKNSNIKGGIGTGTIVGLNGGKIVNCTIQNVEVKGAEKIGGFAGIGMTSSWMENCIVSDDTSIVYGEKYTGGIVGYMNNNAAIVNCVNRANITGKEYIGGIVGISFYGTIIKVLLILL